MCTVWNAKTQPLPTVPCWGPHLSGLKHACPLMGVGRVFMRPQCLPGGSGLCPVIPRFWMEVKLAHGVSPALPAEFLFIGRHARNSNCPKPQESYKVAAGDPALLSPTMSELRCHQAGSRCYSSLSVILVEKQTLSAVTLSQWLPHGTSTEGEYTEGAGSLLRPLVVVAHH